MSKFDWNSDDTFSKPLPGLAVFVNVRGDLSIAVGFDEPQIISLPVQLIEALERGIESVKREIEG